MSKVIKTTKTIDCDGTGYHDVTITDDGVACHFTIKQGENEVVVTLDVARAIGVLLVAMTD